MNGLNFLVRVLIVCLFFAMALGLVFMEKDPLAATITFLATAVYAWPIRRLALTDARLYLRLPDRSAFTRQRLLEYTRWYLGFSFTCAGIGAFLQKDGRFALPFMVVSLTLTYPLDGLFFPPAATPQEKQSGWHVVRVILRNIGVLICLSAVNEDQYPNAQALTAWCGVALVFAHPLFLLITKGEGAVTLSPVPVPIPASPKPAAPKRTARPDIQFDPPWAKKSPSPNKKKKVSYLDAYSLRWRLKPALINETFFNQLIRDYQTNWLEANDYHQRLRFHRTPDEFKNQVIGQLNDYIKEIRVRPEISKFSRVLAKQDRLNAGLESLAGTVPDEIDRVWKADKRLRSLFNAMQAYCAQPGAKRIWIILPHIAEYRAMINLIRRIKHSMSKPRFPALD